MSEYWISCPLRTVAVVLIRKGLCESVSDYIPLGPDTTYPSHLFGVLLLRRLRPPLPLSARICLYRRILDPLSDHDAACAQAAVLTGRGISLGKGSSQSLSGSRGQGHHQHQHQRSQPGPHQPARRQKDPGHSQGTHIVRGSATRGRHHLGIAFDFIQPVPKTCWPIRKSGVSGPTIIQGARMPRMSPFQTVQALGAVPKHPPQS